MADGDQLNIKNQLAEELLTEVDALHVGHVGAELSADNLDRVISDLLVDLNEGSVVNLSVRVLQAAADLLGGDLLHEVCLQHRDAGIGEEVVAVLCGIGNDNVHLIELLAGNGVRNERNLMERLVVSRLRLDSDPVMHSKASSTPALIMATIRIP